MAIIFQDFTALHYLRNYYTENLNIASQYDQEQLPHFAKVKWELLHYIMSDFYIELILMLNV